MDVEVCHQARDGRRGMGVNAMQSTPPNLIVQQDDQTLYQKRLQSRETGKSFSNR